MLDEGHRHGDRVMTRARAAAPPPLKFTETDAARAYHEWRCNCGPGALAACLGWTLDAVRPHLGDFEAKGYMSPTMMIQSVESSGHVRRPAPNWPVHGLVRIQFGGPWLKPGVPPAAAYKATHWVASKRQGLVSWVFDVNGGWMAFEAWANDLVPMLIAEIKRADGTWDCSHCWEVRKTP